MPNRLPPTDYKLYRSGPRGLRSLLRGEREEALERPAERGGAGVAERGGGGLGREPGYTRYRAGRGGGGRIRLPWSGRGGGGGGRRLTPKRAILGVLALLVAWVGLSFVLFMISAQTKAGNLPAGAGSQLTSGGPMLTSANTILVLGLDTRPTTGPGSKEPGASHNEAVANTDTIILWRLGGGVSRRLSIPRDTLVNIPGHGEEKINAAWSQGGPALALQVIKQFTGVQINHLVVVDLANFPKFIDDIGGVTVRTGKVCSTIAGGARDGGFTLYLNPGVHHLDGLQAETLARTRDNACNPASNDLTREAIQQQILNSIKSQLLTFHTFLHLPWAAWDAPGVIQTDMGGLSLLQMFFASEIGGSAPINLLSETPQVYNGEDVLVPSQANVHAQVQKLLNG
jgi:LCP family protein required for cell wall assembly